MAKRTFTEVLTDVNIATEKFLVKPAVSQIVSSNIVSSRLKNKSKGILKGKWAEFALRYHSGTVIEKNSQFENIITQIFETLDKGKIVGQTLELASGIGGEDYELKNVGAEQLFSLTEEKMQAMADAFEIKLGEMLFRNNSADATKMTAHPSLYDICANVATSTSICNITPDSTKFDGTNYAFNWIPNQGSYSSLTYAMLVNPASSYFIEKIIRTRMSAITEGSLKKPTLIIMPQYVWDAYDEVISNKGVATLGVKTVDNGVDVIKFRGADIVAESWCPGGALNPAATSTILYINENFLNLAHSPNMNYKYYGWKQLENQWVIRSMMRHYGTLYPTRRDVHGSDIGLPSNHTS